MSANTYDIKALATNSAANAAGYVAYNLGRDLVTQYVQGAKPGFRNVKFYQGNEPERGGLFGLPVFNPIHFGTMDEKRPVEWVRLLRKERMPELYLPCVLFTINGSKSVVKTEVVGQRKIGSVKEFMGYNDYQVRITGVLFNTKEKIDEYPIKQFNDLRRVCEAPVAVPVVNTILNRAGIMNLVIEDFSFPPFPGKENVQPFELSCVSDEPFELKIKNRSDVLRQERIGVDAV
jgi:hypothetical protein